MRTFTALSCFLSTSNTSEVGVEDGDTDIIFLPFTVRQQIKDTSIICTVDADVFIYQCSYGIIPHIVKYLFFHYSIIALGDF